MRILIIEDDPSLLMVFSDTLEDEGHAVTRALSVADATFEVKSQTFELIILDLNLKGECALEIAALAAKTSPETKVMVVTGYDLNRFEQLCVSPSNVSRVLRKPIRINELLEAITDVCDEAAA
ncbi:MAG: response regulator [Pseudomonadota bacterium]